MRGTIALLTAALLSLPGFVVADHEGKPHAYCDERGHDCTDVNAGTMECMPESGRGNDLGVVVGSADEGTFKLEATGINHETDTGCVFEIHIRVNEIAFNEGWTIGLLAPYGGASNVDFEPCFAIPGDTCFPSATFTWWRAQHGVTFDVPYDLVVNGRLVGEGKVHYYDPPALEAVTGGPVTL